MKEKGEIQEKTVLGAIRKGATPGEVEKAVKNRGVCRLSESCNIDRKTIYKLVDRWGVAL